MIKRVSQLFLKSIGKQVRLTNNSYKLKIAQNLFFTKQSFSDVFIMGDMLLEGKKQPG